MANRLQTGNGREAGAMQPLERTEQIATMKIVAEWTTLITADFN
jgi:hypothetical protein